MTQMFALLFVMCCVGSGLCDELITHLQKSYRMCVSNCVRSRHLKTAEAKFQFVLFRQKKTHFKNRKSIYGLKCR